MFGDGVGDGVGDGWGFFWKGSTARWVSNDVFVSPHVIVIQMFTNKRPSSQLQPNLWMEPTWNHHGVMILSFVWYEKNHDVLHVGELNPSR